MTVHVCGLGPSLKNFKPDGNFSIGCNDIFRTVETDFLIVVSRLPIARADIVRASRPKVLLSSMSIWQRHPCYEPLPAMMRWRDNKRNDINMGLYYSNNTPFIACSYAYKYLQAKEIVLWGVDFLDHPYLKDDALLKTWTDFKQLEKELSENNCRLVLGSSGSVLDLPSASR